MTYDLPHQYNLYYFNPQPITLSHYRCILTAVDPSRVQLPPTTVPTYFEKEQTELLWVLQ